MSSSRVSATRPFTMLDEIFEQPAAIERTVSAGARTAPALRRRFERQKPRMVFLAARGTSDNAAQFGRYLIEITTGIPVSLAAPSALTLYGRPVDCRHALAVGISQSGESTDTNAFVAEAGRLGALTVGITNESRSTLARIAGETIEVCAGIEKSVAATKTYTGQLMAFYLLAYSLGAAIDLDDLRQLSGYVESALQTEPLVRDAAASYAAMNRAITIGRGLNYCNALEFGLKLMETSYVSAHAFSAADLMHGPIALVKPSFPAFVFAPQGATWASIRLVLDRLYEPGAETLVITDLPTPEAHGLPRCIRLTHSASNDSAIEDLYSPAPFIVPAQLFTAHLASAKGLNADAPRGLNKITLTM